MEGANIKKFRELNNMSQQQLANEIGVTQSYIAQIERGTRAIPLPLAKQIASVLNVSITDF